jgi:glycosyltransferase involved in cell wall biosynthesis
MKSVLFFSLMNGSAWGGSEELWYKTALWMCSNGYEVGICCYDWEEKKNKLQALQNKGCTLYLLPEKKVLKRFLGKWKLKSAIKKIPFEKFDFVLVNQGGWEEIIHGPFKGLHVRLKKYAICYHNYNSNAKLPVSKQNLLQQWINKAAVNIALAGKIFEVLKINFDITVPNQVIYYNPITFQPPVLKTNYPSLENNNYLWVMLAELDIYRKAQDVLIETLATDKWKDRNWILHLYGKGKDEEFLKKLIEDRGLQDKILLQGFTDNVQQVLSDCHFLFQITHIDAMPISVVEAMAMARPCIVSNVGDMTKWVSHGINGFVCEKPTIENIDTVLEECWHQKHNWGNFGEHAYQSFIQKYPQPYEEKMAALLTAYYNK